MSQKPVYAIFAKATTSDDDPFCPCSLNETFEANSFVCSDRVAVFNRQ